MKERFQQNRQNMKSFLLASGGVAFLALGVLSAGSPAQAAALYGAYGYKSGTGTTYDATRVGTINSTTGTFNPLNIDVGTYLTDIAVRSINQGPDEIFGTSATSINQTTGAVTNSLYSITSTGLNSGQGTNLGTIIGVTEILTGLGFASNGNLYAIGGGFITGAGTGSDATNGNAGLYT